MSILLSLYTVPQKYALLALFYDVKKDECIELLEISKWASSILHLRPVLIPSQTWL